MTINYNKDIGDWQKVFRQDSTDIDSTRLEDMIDNWYDVYYKYAYTSLNPSQEIITFLNAVKDFFGDYPPINSRNLKCWLATKMLHGLEAANKLLLPYEGEATKQTQKLSIDIKTQNPLLETYKNVQNKMSFFTIDNDKDISDWQKIFRQDPTGIDSKRLEDMIDNWHKVYYQYAYAQRKPSQEIINFLSAAKIFFGNYPPINSRNLKCWLATKMLHGFDAANKLLLPYEGEKRKQTQNLSIEISSQNPLLETYKSIQNKTSCFTFKKYIDPDEMVLELIRINIEACGTMRVDLKEELLNLVADKNDRSASVRRKAFEVKVNSLLSKEHEQGYFWSPGWFNRGSRLRKTLDNLQQLLGAKEVKYTLDNVCDISSCTYSELRQIFGKLPNHEEIKNYFKTKIDYKNFKELSDGLDLIYSKQPCEAEVKAFIKSIITDQSDYELDLLFSRRPSLKIMEDFVKIQLAMRNYEQAILCYVYFLDCLSAERARLSFDQLSKNNVGLNYDDFNHLLNLLAKMSKFMDDNLTRNIKDRLLDLFAESLLDDLIVDFKSNLGDEIIDRSNIASVDGYHAQEKFYHMMVGDEKYNKYDDESNKLRNPRESFIRFKCATEKITDALKDKQTIDKTYKDVLPIFFIKAKLFFDLQASNPRFTEKCIWKEHGSIGGFEGICKQVLEKNNLQTTYDFKFKQYYSVVVDLIKALLRPNEFRSWVNNRIEKFTNNTNTKYNLAYYLRAICYTWPKSNDNNDKDRYIITEDIGKVIESDPKLVAFMQMQQPSIVKVLHVKEVNANKVIQRAKPELTEEQTRNFLYIHIGR